MAGVEKLEDVEARMIREGVEPRTKEAWQWYKKNIKRSRRYDRATLLKDRDRITPKKFIGRMYFFAYDAKLKETLPIWDVFPLVIPVDFDGQGFLGMNLHYLPPNQRILLLHRLKALLNNDKYDDTTRFRITYELLTALPKFDVYKKTLHRYLYSHIESKIVMIHPDEWETAVYLPLEKFRTNE